MANGLRSHVLTAVEAALVTAVVGILITPVADRVTTSVKNALNAQELRSAKIEAVTTELSVYLFEAANLLEALSRTVHMKSSLEAYVGAYNKAVTAVRSHEYSNRAILERLWGAEIVGKYGEVMGGVRALDAKFHEATPTLEEALLGAQNGRITLKANALGTIPTESDQLLADLRKKAEPFLARLASLR